MKLMKGKDIKIPVLTIHQENMALILHMKKYIFQSKQYSMNIFAHQN